MKTLKFLAVLLIGACALSTSASAASAVPFRPNPPNLAYAPEAHALAPFAQEQIAPDGDYLYLVADPADTVQALGAYQIIQASADTQQPIILASSSAGAGLLDQFAPLLTLAFTAALSWIGSKIHSQATHNAVVNQTLNTLQGAVHTVLLNTPPPGSQTPIAVVESAALTAATSATAPAAAPAA